MSRFIMQRWYEIINTYQSDAHTMRLHGMDDEAVSMLRNHALEEYRSDRRYYRHTTAFDGEPDICVNDMEAVNERLALKSAFGNLNPLERRIVQIHSIEGVPFHEMAFMLDRPEGTIKTLYYRALKKLRKIMQKK